MVFKFGHQKNYMIKIHLLFNRCIPRNLKTYGFTILFAQLQAQNVQ